MKTCPICGAVAFDDALVCYGCMYRYDDNDAPEGVGGYSQAPSGKMAGESPNPPGKHAGENLAPPEQLEGEPRAAPAPPVTAASAPIGDSEGRISDSPDNLEDEASASPDSPATPSGLAAETPPTFFIRMIPTREESGSISWTCTVELAAG
jgi:hypothetical protein